jgi:hypothetical protein
MRFFPVSGQTIWGATHRITRNLLDVLAGLAEGTPRASVRSA